MHKTAIDQAFEAYPRAWFLPPSGADRAGVNAPIAIGYGQTNSQPSTVRQMLQWLRVKPGAHVLDIGSGSGWTTALLSHLVGAKGSVVAVELIPELVTFGRDNCERVGVRNATFHQADRLLGWPASAPYSNILISASASHFPDTLLDQLATPGRLVIPVMNTIYEVTKDTNGACAKRAHPGYVFVPLLGSK